MMKKVVYLIVINLLLVSVANAQTGKLVDKGNDNYNNGDYTNAADAYQKALTKDPKSNVARFNLGNTFYKQDSLEQSRKIMEASAKAASDKQQKADAFYNIGNTYMKEQKWKEAADAYKQALRNNPQDADSKYNLSYALQKLKQQQQQQNQDNKDKDKDKKDQKDKEDKKDDKQDKKDDQKKDQQKQDDKKKEDDKKDGGDKGDDKKDKQDPKDGQDNKDKQGDDKKEDRPKPMPSNMSKQQADQLLNALQQEEKKLQDKLKQGKAVPVKVEKDW